MSTLRVVTSLLALVLILGHSSLADSALASPPTPVVWRTGPVLDQGELPACVAAAWVGWLRTYPYPTSSPTYASIYWAGQHLDAEYGLYGPTIRTAARVLQELGLLQSVRYTSSVAEASQFLSTQGPIIVASQWYEGMERPEAGRATIQGAVLGHHSYVCYGLDGSDWLCQNSYGSHWGAQGRFRIEAAPLQDTLWFEVALPTKRAPQLTALLAIH